jgi:hypothetical protein
MLNGEVKVGSLGSNASRCWEEGAGAIGPAGYGFSAKSTLCLAINDIMHYIVLDDNKLIYHL